MMRRFIQISAVSLLTTAAHAQPAWHAPAAMICWSGTRIADLGIQFYEDTV
jgi:hypothetical protein